MKVEHRKCCDCKQTYRLETMYCYDHFHYLCENCQKKVDEYWEKNPTPSPEAHDE